MCCGSNLYAFGQSEGVPVSAPFHLEIALGTFATSPMKGPENLPLKPLFLFYRIRGLSFTPRLIVN